jgi:ferredoxin
MGALTAIVGKFGFMRIHRRRREDAKLSEDGPETGEMPMPSPASNICIDCGICTRRCPMNIRVHEQEVVKQSECIDCGRCVAACPVPGALEHRFFGKRVSVVVVLILSAALYFGAILAMQAFGLDRYSSGAEATLRELAKQSGITTMEFKKEYGLPASLPDRTGVTEIQSLIPISVVAGQNGMSTADLKKLFNLSPDLPDSTAWEPTLDAVSAGVFASSMGMDFETFLSSYGLDNTITPETPFREVRLQMAAMSAEADSAGSGEPCAAEGGTGCTED